MDTDIISVIVCRPKEKPVREEIKNDLKSLQDLVGGHIECINGPAGTIIVLNEEGKLLGLPMNFSIIHDALLGTVVFVDRHPNGEDFASIPESKEDMIKKFVSLGRKAIGLE